MRVRERKRMEQENKQERKVDRKKEGKPVKSYVHAGRTRYMRGGTSRWTRQWRKVNAWEVDGVWNAQRLTLCVCNADTEIVMR